MTRIVLKNGESFVLNINIVDICMMITIAIESNKGILHYYDSKNKPYSKNVNNIKSIETI